ncbi:kinesin motor domain-containing protein [Haematococcus lacustris]|uniref:Kinesin motor domain-containing protein n=1 Tax=Haematococcus lacustris TaxID=44745 RepID=A0A699YJF6_HAELA|nr:kinesin motor domain-containing protein [Haematococcus lacustris]
MEAGDSDRLRQKEASNINRSLLTLGTVIRALGDLPAARKHVPFRDSKLTRILQPALAGNARMAIVVTISPAGRAVDTTRAALHFANAAKRVVMSPKAAKDVWQGALIAKDEESRRSFDGSVDLASTSWWLPSLGPASAAGPSTAGNLEGIPEGGDDTTFQLGSSPASGAAAGSSSLMPGAAPSKLLGSTATAAAAMETE